MVEASAATSSCRTSSGPIRIEHDMGVLLIPFNRFVSHRSPGRRWQSAKAAEHHMSYLSLTASCLRSPDKALRTDSTV